MDVAGVSGCNGLRMQALGDAAGGIVLLGCQESRHADDRNGLDVDWNLSEQVLALRSSPSDMPSLLNPLGLLTTQISGPLQLM